MKIIDLAKAISPNSKLDEIGIRPGEKLHEQMISEEDAHYTYEYNDYYKILPVINNWSSDQNRIKNGKKVEEGFSYTSDNNSEWMTKETLNKWISDNLDSIGKI